MTVATASKYASEQLEHNKGGPDIQGSAQNRANLYAKRFRVGACWIGAGIDRYFSQKRRFPIDQFIESRISSRQSPLQRRIDEMLGTLEPGDRLLVSELSRLGRSLSQVIQIVETLVHRKIRFIAIKEAIEFDGKQDLPTKVMIALFGLFAEVERDLISERTKEGLAAAKAKGKLLGRPKGALGTSRLDGKEQDIRALLGKDVSKASIAKILDISRSALYHFIQTRKIAPA